ncbi:MAG: VOC family protein [Nitrososphaerales archaeon]|nr:VOC family protein [Nitrososphaerales archaeon]
MRAKFTYVGIRVRNLRKSVWFYKKLLGMKYKGRFKIEATKGEVAFLQSSGGKFGIELNYYPRNSPFYTKYTVGEGLDHLAFGVANLERALGEAKRMGHPVVKEIEGKTSRWAYVKDTNGIWIELFEA